MMFNSKLNHSRMSIKRVDTSMIPIKLKRTNSITDVCINYSSNAIYDDEYSYILNCLKNPGRYLNIKNAVLNFLYRRGQNDGKIIDRRKTLELCSNVKLANIHLVNSNEAFDFKNNKVCCSICGKQINEDDKVEIDHLIPSTFFFVLFARYYQTCNYHPRITKKMQGQQFCDEYFERHEECGKFVTKIISFVHNGCNQAKSDKMFFTINVQGDATDPTTTWNLTPNEPVINSFIKEYTNKLYPKNGIYTGIGYMGAEKFETHARMLTKDITKENMIQYMTTRLNTFIQHVCNSYHGGTMAHIFDNCSILKMVPLKFIREVVNVDITDYIDQIDEKYRTRLSESELGLLNGIVTIKKISTQKTSLRLNRNTNYAEEINYFIKSDITSPSFEQVCELIDSHIEKQNTDLTGLGFVRKKTKRTKKTRTNKTRNKRT